MTRIALAAALALLASACSPADQSAPAETAAAPAPSPAAEPAPEPPAPLAAEFANCAWGEVKAAGVSMWSYACPDARVVGDETIPGFVRETTDETGAISRFPVVRIFSIPAGAPIEAALPAIQAASPGSESCALEPAERDQTTDYILMPVGAAREAYNAFLNGDDTANSMPCGQLGPSEGGTRTFNILEGAPDKVVGIDWGTDIQVYAATTLRVSQ